MLTTTFVACGCRSGGELQSQAEAGHDILQTGYSQEEHACGAGSCRSGGCSNSECRECPHELPRELKKTSLPDYVIEPPDTLLIEARSSERPPGARLRPGEMLHVQATRPANANRTEGSPGGSIKQISGNYVVGSNGFVDLGPEYGSVPVANLTVSEANEAIDLHLRQLMKDAVVLVTLATKQNQQRVDGEHLVRPDGTVALGVYGSVYVAGLTLDSARRTIQRHLSGALYDPEVTVDVQAYNSKVYYVITENGGGSEQVFRFPCTGNETVLDALAQISDLPSVESRKHIWIARPGPPDLEYEQILEVDWDSVVRGGQTKTNFQILPGDRVYVHAEKRARRDRRRHLRVINNLFGNRLSGNGQSQTLTAARESRAGSTGHASWFGTRGQPVSSSSTR